MAKDMYGIRASIDRSYLDHEITITGGGWDLRPSPIKQLLFIGGGLLVILWLATSTWIASSGVVCILLFVIWALAALAYFGGLTRTKQLRLGTVPAFLAYLPKTARNVIVRRSANPTAFYSIVGIDAVDEDGRITFADGSVGQAYLVVGSASYLLFDEDRVGILNRVDAFWRKVETTCEYVTITTKEPQRIYRQVAALEQRNQALEVRDPDLLALQAEQYDILTTHVGGQFSSIHQYMVLKGRSADALRRGHNILQAEVEGSALMIKEATMLDRDETLSMLRVFYRSTDDTLTLQAGLTTDTDH